MFIVAEIYGVMLAVCLVMLAIIERRINQEFGETFGLLPSGRRNKRCANAMAATNVEPTRPPEQQASDQCRSHEWVGCMHGGCDHDGDCPWPSCAKCGESL